MGIHLNTEYGHFNNDIVKVDKYFIDYVIDNYTKTGVDEQELATPILSLCHAFVVTF